MKKHSIIIFISIFIITAASLVFYLIRTGKPSSITIGMVPYRDSNTLIEDFEPTRIYLEKEMDITVKVVVPNDYRGLLEGMKKNEIDIGYFGPFSYIASENEIELEPLIVSYRKEVGMYYSSLIVTRSDSNIFSIEDLKNKKYAFVDKGSTSGYVIPLSMYISRNIDIDTFFSTVKFSGTHNNVALDVLKKQADAGSMDDTVYNQMIHDGDLSSDDLRIVWKSEPIPGSPIVAKAELNKNIKESFKKAMIEISEKNPEAIASFDINTEKYIECDSKTYNSIRNVAEILGDNFVVGQFLQKK